MAEDLLTRIQRSHGVTRDAARRILIDLIDYHRRRTSVSANGKFGRNVYKPPISSFANPDKRFRVQNKNKTDPNPHSKTRNQDLTAAREPEFHHSMDTQPLPEEERPVYPDFTFLRPEDRLDGSVSIIFPDAHTPLPAHRKRRMNKGYQPTKYLVFTYNGENIEINKTEFIVTCVTHGMDCTEIAEFLSLYIPHKPDESKSEHRSRVYKQVYVTKRNKVDKATKT